MRAAGDRIMSALSPMPSLFMKYPTMAGWSPIKIKGQAMSDVIAKNGSEKLKVRLGTNIIIKGKRNPAIPANAAWNAVFIYCPPAIWDAKMAGIAMGGVILAKTAAYRTKKCA